MPKRTFEITYKDPESGEIKTVTEEFEHKEEFPAQMWADDRGYTLADKGWYKIKEIK